jgi:hypothetical protein
MSIDRTSHEYIVPDIILRTASDEQMTWDSTDSFSRRRSYISILADYYEQDPPPPPSVKKPTKRWWKKIIIKFRSVK